MLLRGLGGAALRLMFVGRERIWPRCQHRSFESSVIPVRLEKEKLSPVAKPKPKPVAPQKQSSRLKGLPAEVPRLRPGVRASDKSC